MTNEDRRTVRIWHRREIAKNIALGFIVVGVVLILAGQILANSARLNDNNRALKEQDKQTQTIINQNNEQTALLTKQNELIVCLLQLASGGDFTQKAECQQKAAAAQQQFRSGQPVTPQPQANPAPNPTPTTPKKCTVDLLGLCL